MRKWPYLSPWFLNQKNKTTLFPSTLKSLFCKNQLGVQFLPSYMKPQKRNESEKLVRNHFCIFSRRFIPSVWGNQKKWIQKMIHSLYGWKNIEESLSFFLHSQSSLFFRLFIQTGWSRVKYNSRTLKHQFNHIKVMLTLPQILRGENNYELNCTRMK